MRKGIHTVAQKRLIPRHRPMPYLLLAGILLIGTAGGAFGRESETPTMPEQAAEAAPVEEVAGETPAVAEEDEWERQIDELTQRRRELEETAGNVAKELQESERRHEQRQRQLRERLEDIHAQIRDIAARTFELQRERLRREYQRELEALERSYRQTGEMERMPLPPMGLERPEPWRREMAENVEGIRRELRGIQEQREQDGNRWREVRERLGTMMERVEAVEQRTEGTQRAIEEGRTERQVLNQRQTDSLRRQEELRVQLHQVAEQQRGLKERTETVSGEVRQQIDRLCTDVQRMGQTVGRIEQDRIRAEDGLKTQVAELDNHVRALQIEQARTQGALSMLLSQGDRSTVGSAGRTWGW